MIDTLAIGLNNPDEDEEIISEAVHKAQEVARQNGFKIGDVFAVPSDEYAWKILEIRGDTIVGILPNNKTKEFKLKDAFDPNVARENALEEKLKRHHKEALKMGVAMNQPSSN